MAIEPGQRILHYEIVDKIGEGGMGVVWKAVDTTLDREVAIKVLPDAFVADAERLARFEQEARLLASLNHTSIAAVYSVHEHEGARFLAMELVDGEDLSQRLARGPLAVEEALEIALQVAEALEAAHDNGVIHRDLKPANIQLMPTGKIKVLDFGLAKALVPETASGDPSLSPTMTSAGTVAGMIIGTAGYMSPEQARGRTVDRRADIWAFGCVLFEMLSGRKTFEGETISDTLASVLKVDPDWEALPDATPPTIRRLLRRCLARDADRRLSHASGARLDLRETLDGAGEVEASVAEAPSVAPRSGWASRLPWVLVALLALATLFTAWQLASLDDETELLTLVAPFPKELTLPPAQVGVVALSPDGKSLAATLQEGGETRLYLRRLNESALIPLPGTEDAETPFFSPDGQWLAFFADDKLKKISVDGGNPVTLCDSVGGNRGASWGKDDRIVFTPHYTEPLMQVSGGGGVVSPLTSLDRTRNERTHRWPYADPEQDFVLFTVGGMDSPESYDGSTIDAVRPSTGERVTVLEGASAAWYVKTGHLIFSREGFLFAVPFDSEKLEVRGTPVPVVENVMTMRNSGLVHAGFAANGLLAYVEGAPRARRSHLAWRYRDGRTESLEAPVAGYRSVRLSPDRSRIAAAVEGDTTYDIWIYDIERKTPTRLTFEGDNTFPVWSPDGRTVAFASVRDNALMSTYVKPADGSGAATRIYSPDRHANAGQTTPYHWSSDGRHLMMELTNENAVNLLALTVEEDRAEILLETPATEQNPTLSPDGRWMAYSSDEGTRFNIYVRPFPGPGGKWQISVDGGVNPRWSPDGSELFFRWQRQLFSVRIDTSHGSFSAGSPEVVLDGLGPVVIHGDFAVYDSDRFLIVEPAGDESAPAGVTVVVNWLDELRRRVPN